MNKELKPETGRMLLNGEVQFVTLYKGADAYMANAAPDLLKACIDLNSELDTYWNSAVRNDEMIKAIAEKQKQCLKAINKALNIQDDQQP